MNAAIFLFFVLGHGSTVQLGPYDDLPACRNAGRTILTETKAIGEASATYTCTEATLPRQEGTMLIAPYASFNGPMSQSDVYGQ